MNKNGVKILSGVGAELLKNNLEGRKADLHYNAVLADSLLLRKLITMGLDVNKQGKCRDIVALSFEYGYTSKDKKKLDELYEKSKDLSKTTRKNKGLNKRNNTLINKTNDKINMLLEEKAELEEELSRAINKTEQRKIQAKINTRIKKINNLNEIISDAKDNVAKDNKETQRLVDIFNEELNDYIMTIDKTREYLYQKRFTLTFGEDTENPKTIEYVFWFRSPSKCRVGDVLFINKELHDDIRKWQTMGIELKEDKEGKVKLVEMEAYCPLTSSAICTTVNINPNNVFVVSDLDSYTDDMKLLSVELDFEQAIAKEVIGKCKNTIWDGMSIADDSLFISLDGYDLSKAGMMTLRQHMFKTCAFRGYIQKFIKDWCIKNNKDYETYELTDRYSRRIKVKDILLLTTENSMKWEKFFDDKAEGFEYWSNAVNKDNNIFGVTKIDHVSKYGDKQRMSYQMINSINIQKDDINNLGKDTLEFVKSLQNNDEEFIKHLDRTKSKVNLNEVILSLYKQNKSITRSYLASDLRYRLTKDYIKTLREGKLLVEGDNLTVCANPYMLLKYMIGDLDKYIENGVIYEYEDETLPVLEKGYSVYTKRFNNEEKIGAFRNPHNAPNNTMFMVNNISDEMNTYFNFSKNIIAVNAVKTDIQDRANSMDFDSDFVLATNNEVIVSKVEEATEYLTIVNNIPESKKTYKNNILELAKIDNNLAKAKKAIGSSSNVAQLFLSIYWNMKNDNDNKYTEKEIHNVINDVAILSVLAQIAIDNAKREYKIDLNKSIRSFQNQLKGIAKPWFWQFTNESLLKDETISNKLKNSKEYKDIWKDLSKEKKKEIIKDEKTNIINGLDKDIKCPMNFIQDVVDNIERKKNTKRIKDEKFLYQLYVKGTNERTVRRHASKFETTVEQLNKEIKETYEIFKDEDERAIMLNIIFDEVNKEVKKYKMNEQVLLLLLTRTLGDSKYYKNNSRMKCDLLKILYEKDREMFLSCFKDENILSM